VCFLTRGRGPTAVLWGDSFAAHYAPGIQDHAEHLTVDVLEYALSACPPIFGFDPAADRHCRPFNDRLPDIVRRYGARAVIVAARWDYVFRRHITEAQIRETLERLLALGLEVHVLGVSPTFGNNAQTLFAQAGGSPEVAEGRAPLPALWELSARLAKAMPQGVHLIDPLAHLCARPDCWYRKSGEFLIWDNGHFSIAGSDLAVGSFFPYRQ
jgi:hypothetical protein